MSTIGYYRYKFSPTSSQDVNVYVNGILEGTKSVIVQDWCDNNKFIKFLNKDGQYRFFAFNRFWESSDKPKEIGRASNIITSLLNSQSAEKSIGYKNTRSIEVTADVTQDELNILQDLWTSPKVYLHIGTTYSESDWLEVSISTKNTVNKIKKGSVTKIVATIELPEWYSISLL